MLNYMDRDHFGLAVALMQAGGCYEDKLKTDVKVHHLPTGSINVHKLRQLRAIRPLRTLVEAERPDVVCAVMDSASIVALQALKRCSASPKLVLSAQVPPITTYEQSKASSSWYRCLSMKLRQKLAARAYEEADRVVGISQGVEEEVHALAPEVEGRTEVIHNAGVEEEMLRKSQEPLDDWAEERRPLIVACGRLEHEKGFSYLLEAFAEVRGEVPAHLIILGEGGLREALEEQARQLGIAEHVHLPGFQDNPFKYMAAADLFVLSSLFEGFGNVVVEAMACGAPVVATDCPYGPGEVITEGESGLLVPLADASALAGAMRRVLGDGALREKLSRHGRERAESFEASQIAEKYGQLFEEVNSDG
jgi:glycosyltransferase involved in cell wall biosynthesis